MTAGSDFWRMTFAPYARDGYRRGIVDDHEVVLFNLDGERVRIPRPRNGWHPASALFPPSLDDPEVDPEVARGVRYLLSIEGERHELEV